MAYNTISIKKILEKIGNNEVYLPALQRHFVWNHGKIELLFDSIMKNYPIGTFLFWNVDNKLANTYTFYKFITDYHEKIKCTNDKASQPEMKDEIIGVLDGQQRLSSMYIALQGTYAYKLPYKWTNSVDAYPKRELYLNLLHIVNLNDSNDRYEFSFLTKEEASQNDNEHYWFKVKNIITMTSEDDPDDYVEDNDVSSEREMKREAKKILKRLWNRIHLEELINYFEIDNPNLDNILDIFVRVNSAGQQLSRSDLLFSTIVANWDEAREEMENALAVMNGKGDGFKFNTDFIIRECLVLTDKPVLLKVATFEKKIINEIRQEWNHITKVLYDTVDILVEFGYSDENLTSYNAVMPLSYYLYKGGKTSAPDKENMRKYLAVSMINGVFGTHGDSVLRDIRKAIVSKNDYTKFDFNWFKGVSIGKETPYEVTRDMLESLFDSNQKNAYTFIVLSLLYPHLKLNQYKFHQDHIHPHAGFGKPALSKLGLSEDQIREWQVNRNKLPNLQLLEGSENQSKSDSTFKAWFEDSNNVKNQAEYKNTNYIPVNVSLELKDFEQFYNERKKLMIDKLMTLIS